MSEKWIEPHPTIGFDVNRLREEVSRLVETYQLDFTKSFYLPLLAQQEVKFDRDSLVNFNQGSNNWGGQAYPRWITFNGRMVPGWMILDERQKRTIIDLEYCKRADVRPSITQTHFTNLAEGYLREVIEQLSAKKLHVCHAWLAGFRPGLTYLPHIHGFNNNYQFILHLPVASGPDYEIRYHEESEWSFNGFTPGTIALLDPRAWHSAKFSGSYTRWHICFHVYDLGGNFTFGQCPDHVFEKHLQMARQWNAYLEESKGERFLEWNDQLTTEHKC